MQRDAFIEHRLLTGELIERFPYGETTPASPSYCQEIAERSLRAYWHDSDGQMVPRRMIASNPPLPELVRVVIDGEEMGRSAITDWHEPMNIVWPYGSSKRRRSKYSMVG